MLLLLFVSCLFGQSLAQCDLVPDFSGSCMNLSTIPYTNDDTAQFARDIEGASVDHRGHLFATNYGNATTLYRLGQFYPEQRLWWADPLQNSYFNGIRFFNQNTAYAADKVNHRIVQLNVVIDINTNLSSVASSSTFCTDPTMVEPNDLVVSRTGTIYISGQSWVDNNYVGDGDIWSCLQDGTKQRLEVMGRTNGIELSPDDSILYVSESYNRLGVAYYQKIWKYDAHPTNGTISGKRLFADFEQIDGSIEIDVDGMKTDVDGNLWVTRHGGREVVVFNPAGDVIGRVGLNFPNPTNIEFGGVNGTTAYIVGKCPNGIGGCVDEIQVVRPGRGWTNLQ